MSIKMTFRDSSQLFMTDRNDDDGVLQCFCKQEAVPKEYTYRTPVASSQDSQNQDLVRDTQVQSPGCWEDTENFKVPALRDLQLCSGT